MVVVVSTLLTTRYVPRIKNHVGAGTRPTWSSQAHGVYWQLYDSLCKLELELELGVGLGRGGGGGGDGGLNGYGRRRGEGGERGEGGDGGGGLNGHDDEEEAPTWQAGQNDVQPTEANEEIKAARTGWVTYELAKAWHARYLGPHGDLRGGGRVTYELAKAWHARYLDPHGDPLVAHACMYRAEPTGAITLL